MTDPQVHTSGRLRVLAVEDNTETRLLIRFYLETSFEVQVAPSFEEGVAAAFAGRFDAVLVDINLGTEKTGTDVLAALRGVPEYAATPLIACTAFALPGDQERFLRMGFTAYLSKPFHRSSLLDVLQQVLAPAQPKARRSRSASA